MRLFATGFGPFLDVEENPSQTLAEQCGLPHAILPVEFAAVDRFLDGWDFEAYDALLLMGVAARRDRISLELVGRNRIGATPDTAGIVAGPGPIAPAGPFQLASTLWRPGLASLDPDRLQESVDAGEYLCNYALYRALERFPRHRIGLLHVVSPGALALDVQLETVGRLVAALGSGDPTGG